MTPARMINVKRPRLTALVGAAGIIATSLAALSRPARAAETYNNSLDWVPASASGYSASMRQKEQIDIIAASNAWKTFRAIPAVAQAWAMAEAQIYDPAGPAAMFWQLMALPENKQLVQVLQEMVSDEIVVYAGEDFVNLIELYQTLNASRLSALGPMIGSISSGGGEDAAEEFDRAQGEAMVEVIKDRPELLDVPEIVFGFRIKDREAAKTQLARLEVLANMALEQSPLGAKFERRKIDEAEHLVLFLEGSMIPWPEASGTGSEAEALEALRDVVSKKTLYFSIGVWRDYVLVTVNKNTDHLAKLGAGPALGSREELASLAKFRDRKLVGVSYTSERMMEAQTIVGEDLTAAAEYLGDMIKAASNGPPELGERIDADLKAIASDFAEYLPAPGATASFSFLTQSGYEGYSYNWGTMPALEGGKPLGVAEHLGGSPIIAIAARSAHDPEGYDKLAKWILKAYGYFNDFAVPQMEEEERDEFNKEMEVAGPLFKRLHEVTRDKLVPALADGQSALVFDADIASKQWQKDMPASHAPLPMLEFAIVVGVADAKLLTEAMSDYRQIVNDAIDAVRREHPDEVPESFRWVAPKSEQTSDGMIYSWQAADDLGLDDQLALCGAVGENYASFASSRALAERTLAEHSLSEAGEIAEDADKPRGAIAGFSWAGLLSAIEPWAMYGIRSSLGDPALAAADPSSDPPPVQEISKQVKTAFSVLKCYRGTWSETRREGDVWVSHSVSTFEDLED
ncbi:MAG TPA: hypothetical protein VEQ85_06810 [Lacipirellulaceae bacterium]|nr:hypothetical protein [Lacipirellulaceae bacterium]